MTDSREARPRVVFAFNGQMWDDVSTPDNLARLGTLFDYETAISDVPSGWTEPPKRAPEVTERLVGLARGASAIVVSHGSPLVDGELLARVPGVRFVGELEGDRFASRIDVEACVERGVRVVDTNNFCSPPVAEWALAMMLMGLRNYGFLFRRAVHEHRLDRPADWIDNVGYRNAELTGKTVGLIGFGHIGRHLMKLMAPFETKVYAYDPYVPPELGEVFGVTFTSLDQVMSRSDVVVCLVPLTPRTEGMVGSEQVDLMKDGAVFVNVARGKVVDNAALIRRARLGELIVCLDVNDPEPLHSDSPLFDIPTVILSPHIAGVVAAGRPRTLSLMIDELERHFAGHEPWFSILPRTLANRYGRPVPQVATT